MIILGGIILLPLLAPLIIYLLWKMIKVNRITLRSGAVPTGIRAADGIVLLLIGGTILVLMAFSSGTGGLLGTLGQLQPQYAWLNVIDICAATAAGIFLAALLAWRWARGRRAHPSWPRY